MAASGGKRKRVGLSLKSFKKPALNCVNEQSTTHNLLGKPPSKRNLSLGLGKADLTNGNELHEVPNISAIRMKLLSLMPKFSNWKKMDPFPLNPLMKALTAEQNSDVNNDAMVRKQGNKHYVDLPKLGLRYWSEKMNARLITSNENDESYKKKDVLAHSEIQEKRTEIIGFGELTDSNQNKIFVDSDGFEELASVIDYSKPDQINQKSHHSVKEYEYLQSSFEKNLDRQSQCKSFVCEDDVGFTKNHFENIDICLDDFNFDEPCSSGTTKTSFLNTGRKEQLKLSERKSTESKKNNRNPDLADIVSTKSKSKTSKRNSQKSSFSCQSQKERNGGKIQKKTVVSSSQERMMKKFFYTTGKDESIHENVSNKNFEGTDGLELEQATPPIIERKTFEDGRSGYRESRAQEKERLSENCSKQVGKVGRSENISVYAHKENTSRAKSNSFDKPSGEIHTSLSTKNPVSSMHYVNNDAKCPQASRFNQTFVYENIKNSKTKTSVNVGTSKVVKGVLGSDKDLFGDDDDLDEYLAKSFAGDFENATAKDIGDLEDRNNQGKIKTPRAVKENLIVISDDSDIDDVIGSLDNDIDDDTLMACCDKALLPTIPVEKKARSSTTFSKGVKRRLDSPDEEYESIRSNYSSKMCSSSSDLNKSRKKNDCLTECPLCAKHFHSGLSMREIDQHISVCCGIDDFGKDDAFW